MTITMEKIEALRAGMRLLEKAPEKSVGITRRTVVVELAEELKRGLALGYTHKQLADWISTNGIAISPVTLGQYMRDLGIGKKRSASRKRKGMPKNVVPTDTTGTANAAGVGAAAKDAAPAPAQEQQSRAGQESLTKSSGRPASLKAVKQYAAASRPAPSGDGERATENPPIRGGPVATSGSFIPRGDSNEI